MDLEAGGTEEAENRNYPTWPASRSYYVPHATAKVASSVLADIG